ncbi:tyrosine-type recombinase/integrase [Flavobacteriaceae bacterium F89]|uniref:Tyrosine recombinase XerC n=1 Tax=Cerina litoralis TaxID=2874477 RepID=A0AAE3ESI7_9FLAO|nr:tyrosine-type recombinase/integrase [Cerina litoralis]MCG2459648.1 tyrosine-type recombinase/integrase [Cerina litoralis]
MAIPAFLAYLSLEKKYSPLTIVAYKGDLEDFARFCLEEYQTSALEKVEYAIIRNWIVQMSNAQISNRSINRKISALRAYYNFLLKIGEIRISPLARHRSLKTPKKVEIPFSESEMETVLRQIPFDDNFEGTRDRLIIELLYATGIRRSELVNLKMNRIDLSTKTIKVVGKRNKERIVPLLDSTADFLAAYIEERNGLVYRADNAYLFLLKSGNKIYETLVYRIINKYFSLVSPKVKKSPHILRHTFATHMLNKGADLNSVKELLGHSSLASTQVYTHTSIAELKRVHGASHPRSKK